MGEEVEEEEREGVVNMGEVEGEGSLSVYRSEKV